MIDRFGPEIRADLMEVGVDLSVWLARQRVKSLLELIDQLPSYSRFQHAVLNDPDSAMSLAEAEFYGETTDGEPSGLGREWRSAEATMLRLLHDTYVASKSESRPQPFPEPATLVSGYLRKLEQDSAQEVFGELGF